MRSYLLCSARSHVLLDAPVVSAPEHLNRLDEAEVLGPGPPPYLLAFTISDGLAGVELAAGFVREAHVYFEFLLFDRYLLL